VLSRRPRKRIRAKCRKVLARLFREDFARLPGPTRDTIMAAAETARRMGADVADAIERTWRALEVARLGRDA
jgi:hypothetical protein